VFPVQEKSEEMWMLLKFMPSTSSTLSHIILREECFQPSWTFNNPLTITVSDVGPHRPHQTEAFGVLCWGCCVFLQNSTVKLSNIYSGYYWDYDYWLINIYQEL
ncbi:hypothetical protein AMECASPLE_021479, partial [Ameca splendens]